MISPNIIVPEIKPEREINPDWKNEWYKRMEDRWNPPFEIPNIEFHYDHNDFFNRNLSIRAARDWQHSPFWFIIAVLFFTADIGFVGLKLFLSIGF